MAGPYTMPAEAARIAGKWSMYMDVLFLVPYIVVPRLAGAGMRNVCSKSWTPKGRLRRRQRKSNERYYLHKIELVSGQLYYPGSCTGLPALPVLVLISILVHHTTPETVSIAEAQGGTPRS